MFAGSPSEETTCALSDSTLLMIGRDRLADVRLKHEQKRFHTIKDLLANTPYARHLSAEAISNLVEAVSLKDFPGACD